MSWVLSVVQGVITLSVVTFAAVWVWYQWAHRRKLAFSRKLPTVLPTFPLLGHLPYLSTTVKVGCGMIEITRGSYTKGISCLWLGPVPWIILNRAEDIRVILNNSQTLEKAPVYKALSKIFRNGLLTAPVHMWKVSRKQINPIFSSHNLKHLLPTINESADRLVQDMSKHVGGGTFNVEHHLFKFTLTNILKLLYGPIIIVDHDSIIIGAIRVAASIASRIVNPLLLSDTINRVIKRQDWNFNIVFQKRFKELNKKTSSENETIKTQNETGKTIIEVIQTLGKINPQFDEEYQLDEVLTFITTGTDSNAIVLSSCLLALGVHPAVQEKLYREIVTVAGEGPGPVHLEDVHNMVYLEQVLKETMRRFVTVTVVGRRCNKDIQLRDKIIPKDCTVLVSLLGLHTDPSIFPYPFKFDPDRFSPENVAKMDNYDFLPFSGGPRGCIAKFYSLMAMKIALVHLMRAYEFRSDVDILNMEFKYAITTKSKSGYPISIKKRKLDTYQPT